MKFPGILCNSLLFPKCNISNENVKTSLQCNGCTVQCTWMIPLESVAGKGLHYRQFSSRVRTQESLCINMPSTIHVHTPLVEHIHTALVEHSCTNHPTRSRCVLICSQPCTFIAYACTNTFTLRWWNTFTAFALVRTIRVTCNELAL